MIYFFTTENKHKTFKKYVGINMKVIRHIKKKKLVTSANLQEYLNVNFVFLHLFFDFYLFFFSLILINKKIYIEICNSSECHICIRITFFVESFVVNDPK